MERVQLTERGIAKTGRKEMREEKSSKRKRNTSPYRENVDDCRVSCQMIYSLCWAICDVPDIRPSMILKKKFFAEIIGDNLDYLAGKLALLPRLTRSSSDWLSGNKEDGGREGEIRCQLPSTRRCWGGLDFLGICCSQSPVITGRRNWYS